MSIYLDLATSSPAQRTEHVLAFLYSQPEVGAPLRHAVQAALERDLGVPDEDVSLLLPW